MRIALDSPSKKRALWLVLFLLVPIYLAIVTVHFAADWLSNRATLGSLRAATKLDPLNAEYRHRLARYYDLVDRNPSAALDHYQAAARLNPHNGQYWLAVADAYQTMGDVPRQSDAIGHAVVADPTTPDIAWEAANLYLVEGQNERALHEFGVVMYGSPNLTLTSLQLCWRITQDVDLLLRQVVPAHMDAYQDFLNFLMAKQNTEGTAKVWDAMVRLRQPIEAPRVFNYIRYLLLNKAVGEADLVWQQATSLLGLSAYLPSSSNLIVNASFELDVLNGGFDWQYGKQQSVSLTLDTAEMHDGHRSLAIVFDGPGVIDAGIYQVIVVQPNTTYQFSGYYKNDEIDGAGGPHFTLQDLYTANVYYRSDVLREGASWTGVGGEFTTGPDTHLLVLRVERLPAGSPIRGKMWIDEFRLSEKAAGGTS